MLFSIDEETRRDRVALIDAAADASWTYAELSDRVRRLRDTLAAPEKNLVFLFSRNDLHSVARYLAALEAGHAVALLNDRLAPQLAATLIALYRPEWVLGPVPLDSDYESTGDQVARRRIPSDSAPIHPDLALLLSTSGSTGSPKLVRLSLRNIESNASSISQALSVASEDVPIAHLPVHYSYGLSVLNSHLRCGASIVLSTQGIVTAEFWNTIRRYRVNSFSGVPYTYQMLRRLGLDQVNAPGLSVMTQAGGKMDSGNVTHFHQCMSERGGRFYVMYGQTEATARISVLPFDEVPRKPDSAGRAIPGGAIFIHDENGSPISQPGISGELVYTGPNVMMGYADCREDLAKGDELAGRLFTGDLARLDAQGDVFILGRSKRDAKVFGLRVNLDELEAFVKRSGPAAAVAGRDRIVVFCEFGTRTTLRDIQDAVAAQLKIHHSAFEFRRIQSLPTRDTGKINYETLLAQL